MNDKKIENSKYLLKDIEGIVKLVQTLSENIKDFKENYEI